MVVDSDDDHELVLLVGGDEVGRVPVAVLDEDPPWSSGSETDVLDEALKKSTVVWVEVPGEGGTEGSFYVNHAVSEAQVPGLAGVTSGRYEDSIVEDLMPALEIEVLDRRVR